MKYIISLFLVLFLGILPFSFLHAADLPNPLGATSFMEVLVSIINALMYLGAPIVTGVILWAAFILTSSGGEPEKITKGKDAILYAVIGYAIILLAKAIASILQTFFTP
ncbi:MAG: pilin [Candidatus Paceibacterota bacterium]